MAQTQLSQWLQNEILTIINDNDWEETKVIAALEVYVNQRVRSKKQREEAKEAKTFRKEKDSEFQKWLAERGTSGSKLMTGER